MWQDRGVIIGIAADNWKGLTPWGKRIIARLLSR
jgi:hypothetical protein